jgi:hypothetical protein
LENLALVVGDGGFDGFPFGFGKFLLFDSVHFKENDWVIFVCAFVFK